MRRQRGPDHVSRRHGALKNTDERTRNACVARQAFTLLFRPFGQPLPALTEGVIERGRVPAAIGTGERSARVGEVALAARGWCHGSLRVVSAAAAAAAAASTAFLRLESAGAVGRPLPRALVLGAAASHASAAARYSALARRFLAQGRPSRPNPCFSQ